MSANQRPADWRERKAQRQKYWSLSQGFRFGRKLADWGGLDDDGDGENDGDGRNIGAAAAAAADAGTEDAQMQEAIRRSLLDATGDGCDRCSPLDLPCLAGLAELFSLDSSSRWASYFCSHWVGLPALSFDCPWDILIAKFGSCWVLGATCRRFPPHWP